LAEVIDKQSQPFTPSWTDKNRDLKSKSGFFWGGEILLLGKFTVKFDRAKHFALRNIHISPLVYDQFSFLQKMLILTAKRILVIDDAEDIREVAQVSLEVVGGWEVLTASSGREGVAKALAEQPDAILLDVMMPDQDGPTTFKQLQANHATRHIPVILLTAKALASDRRMFADLGVMSVIAKPFEPMFLAAQVAEALGWDQA